MTYDPRNYDIFIGVDVDIKSFVVNVKDHANMNRLLKIPANPEAFGNYVEKMYNKERVLCVYEAGPTGYGLCDHLLSREIKCLMVSPLTIPRAGNARVKTNRIDSEKLAQHLKNGDLKPIRVPDPEYRELRQLIRVREDYVKLTRTAKQRIKSLLLAQSLNSALKDVEQNWSALYINRLKILQCTPAVRHRLDLLLDDISYARKQTLRVIKELRGFCTEHTGIRQNVHYLQSIPGIGFITAVTVLGNIGNPRYLRDPQELAGFIGLVPSEYSTGDTVLKGSITHLGNNILRSLLVEAAWVAIRYNNQLAQLYYRIRNRHPAGIGSRKAIVAVARKLTLIIYRVLKDQREYINI